MTTRLSCALLLFCGLACSQSAKYDVILRNGTVVDGSGRKQYRADVGVRNGFIHAIGDLRRDTATIEVDVRSLVVAPGFINLHGHSDAKSLPTAVNMLTQGVTTEIVNADGSGTTDIPSQLRSFSADGLALNLGAYIGFNAIWRSVVGNADRRPSAAQIDAMRKLVTDNLRQGAWGVSSGLDYKPAYFAQTAEVIAVVSAAKAWRTNFPNHDRLTPESRYSSLAAIAETIEIGEKSGLMPVITHMKLQGRQQGSAGKAIAMMRAAAARGHETVADVYPYLAGHSGVGALFVPGWAASGSEEEIRTRWQQPELRLRIAREIEEAIEARLLTPENIYIPSTRRKFTDYMREMKAGAGETMLRILEKDHPAAILTFGAENDLVELLRFPGAAVSCDCGAAERLYTHPRTFGTFPRVLGRYVRDRKVLTLEDAVRKMSGLPASILGLTDRGFAAAGMAADLTVFDPLKITDHATYEEPTLPSEGVRHVLVNGRFAVRDGKPTGEKNGRVLGRAANMPSRGMRMQDGQSLSVKAKDLTVSLAQTDKHGVRGTFHLIDPTTRVEIRSAEAGMLQAHENWASFTARAHVGPKREEKAILVVVDGATMSVEIEGRPLFQSVLQAVEYGLVKRPPLPLVTAR